MPRGRRRRFGRGEPPVTPLCVVLLPGRLGDAALRERADDLVSAPGAVAVEPAALGYGATGHLPRLLRERLAAGQARRMALPGRMRAVMVFAPSQYPLARALLAVHPDSELWYADPGRTPPERWAEEHRAALGRAAVTFDPAPGDVPLPQRNRPLFERMEALGIESGRLGSERLPPAAG